LGFWVLFSKSDEHSEPPHAVALVRPRRERPSRRAPEPCNELPAPHSITSSAAPKGTPKEMIDRLNAATVQALADPLVRSRFADLGFEIFPREQQTPEALGAFQKAQIEKWWPLIKEFGIKAE
jgi:hypothetical protein